MLQMQLEYFAKYIESELGIIYSRDNFFQLQNRLEEITKKKQLKDIDALMQLCQKGPDANLKQLILDTATNNETSFYRDHKVFIGFKQYLLPQLFLAKNLGRPLKIWSAACSTGQEPYSLAVLCLEFQAQNPGFEFEIFASDISERALQRTREGKYTDLEVGRGLDGNLLQKHFKKTADGQWQLDPQICRLVRTEKVNLRSPLTMYGKFDIIFCRNVLIYQKTESKAEIIARLTKQLEPNGFLVMGAGESLIGISQDYEQKEHLNTIFYQVKSSIKAAA